VRNGFHSPKTGMRQHSTRCTLHFRLADRHVRITFTGYHADARTKWYNNVGNGSSSAVNSDYWTIGDYYQASLATTGYNDISLKFDMTRSGSGPQNFKVDISTNGGSSWSTIGTVVVLQNGAAPNASWSSTTPYQAAYTTNITGITAAENQASLLIRWISTSASSSTGGTARIDNVQIQGTLVPAPGAAALVGLAGLIARRRRG